MKKLQNCLYILVALLIIIGAWNYFRVDKEITNIYSPTFDTIINGTVLSGEAISVENRILERSIALEKLNKRTFDSNVITFLITLIFTLLAGVVLSSQEKISNSIKTIDDYKGKIEKTIDDYKEKAGVMDRENNIYNIVQTIYVTSITIANLMETQKDEVKVRGKKGSNGRYNYKLEYKYKITPSINVLIYNIDRKIDELKEQIPKNINQNTKKQLVVFIADSINSLNIDALRKDEPTNSKPLEISCNKLEKLRDTIYELKEIDS